MIFDPRTQSRGGVVSYDHGSILLGDADILPRNVLFSLGSVFSHRMGYCQGSL